MRGRLLNFRAIGRAAGFALIGAAIVATAVYLAREARSAHPRPAEATTSADPLASEMRRCQALAMAAKDDAACEAAWAENRRRFFTYRPAPSAAANSLKQ
jgi:conjugative transfer region protein TrbK